jgi:signal peptidase II
MAGKKSSGAGQGLLPWLGIAFIVVLLDQFTKTLILGFFQWGDSRQVLSFFNIVRAHNTGAAFSFLAHAGGWQRWFFVGLAFVATGFIVYMLRQHGGQKMFAWALSLILGGAIGNVIDRLIHGYVVDFLDFHWAFLSPMFPGGHFPAFNIADCGITIGAILLILDELRRVRRG